MFVALLTNGVMNESREGLVFCHLAEAGDRAFVYRK